MITFFNKRGTPKLQLLNDEILTTDEFAILVNGICEFNRYTFSYECIINDYVPKIDVVVAMKAFND